MIKISVAMATYNGAKFILEQLESIGRQKYPPCELVVTDDRSTDDTLAIITQFAEEAAFPVRIFQNETRLHFANNFLKCAELCNGDWIAFCDQDDFWYDNKLQRIAEEVERRRNDDVVMLCHSADLADERLKRVGRRLPNFRKNELKPIHSHFGFWSVGGCVMAFDARLVKKIESSLRPADHFLPYDPNSGDYHWLPHDKWICILANATGSTAYIAEALGMYRRHEKACTRSHEVVPLSERYKKLRRTGVTFYRFQAEVARETADSLRTLSLAVDEPCLQERLFTSSLKFDEFATTQQERADLYKRRALVDRIRAFAKLGVRRGYFGDPFFSLGAMSFIKDLCFTCGLLDKLPLR